MLNTIDYITSELDELEREEFFRLKMIQKKKRTIAEEELKYAEQMRAQGIDTEKSVLDQFSAKGDDDLVC